MTDKEISKALECCSTGETYADCEKNGCPLYLGITMGCKYVDKENQLYSDALDLINRQQAEIERLEKIRKADNNLITSLNKCYETAKAEAIKEFAEKLKEKCYEDFQETYEMLSPYVTDDDIDNLLKEMEGE